MSKKWKIVLIALGAAALIIVLGTISARNRKIPRVTVAKVEIQDLVSKVTANGKVQAERKVDLSAVVMGQIVNLAVRNGDRVKKGDFLLQIDRNKAVAEEAGSSAALEGSLASRDSARTELEQAQRDFERAKKNFEATLLPEAEYQRAKSVLEDLKTGSYAH